MDPATWSAITAGGPTVILIAVLLIFGVPKLLEVLGWQSAREKEIREVAAALAREGPTMVIAELRSQIAELKKQFEERHEECQAETTMLRRTIDELKDENAELREEIAQVKQGQSLQTKKVELIQVDVQKIQDAQPK